MFSEPDLLQNLDIAHKEFRFPAWDCEQDFTGAMRVSGYTSDSGVALVFEWVEFSMGDGIIVCMMRCFATFEVTPKIQYGRGIDIPYEDIADSETGKFLVSFGTLEFASKGRTFTVPFERDDLVAGGYLDPEADEATPQALLFRVCDTIPPNWLFSEPDYIIAAYDLGPNANRLFTLQDWSHPSADDLYGYGEVRPSESPDIIAMVKAVFEGNPNPYLTGDRNTNWRTACTNDE